MRKLLPLLLLLSACTPDAKLATLTDGSPATVSSVIHWNFECDFPEGKKDSVRSAFSYWDGLTSRQLFQETKECGTMALTPFVQTNEYVLSVFTVDGYYPDDDPQHPRVYGQAQSFQRSDQPQGPLVGGQIRLFLPFTWVNNEKLEESIVRHEIGHILGFKHSGREDCLMYPTINEQVYSTKKKGLCFPEQQLFKQHYGN